MDKAYEHYCLVDPLFYDSPTRIERPDLDFSLTSAPAPNGWERTEFEDWVVYWPLDADLPPQGW